MSSLISPVPADGNKHVQLGKELQVNDESKRQIVLSNRYRQFNIAMFYSMKKKYYVAIPAEVLTKYISANVGCVMDAYISYFTNIDRNMKPFDDTKRVVLCSDDDTMSAN